MKEKLRFIFQRAGFLYIITVLVLVVFFDFKTAIARAKLKSLNRLIPDFSISIAINSDRDWLKLRDEYLEEFEFYLKKVVEYIPHESDAHSLLGYCYYHKGEIAKAIRYYEKSIEINPVNFWPNFNLGVIYYERGEYEKAAQVLEQAISAKPDIAMLILHASKVYKPILHIVKSRGYELENGLKIGFDNCHLLLLYSYEKLEDYPAMLKLALSRAGSLADYQEEYYYYAGLASYHLKQFPRAAYFLQESLQRDPKHPESLQYLGLTLQSMGRDRRAAVDLMRKAELLRQLKQDSQRGPEKIEIQLL